MQVAREQTLLLVLDDLHWADTSTLRVLRLLAETVQDARLMVVTTWRDQPAPTGTLADAAEMLARRHALRIELSGLKRDDVTLLLTSVADVDPTAAEIHDVHQRTDGNPFYLVEFARLARERGSLAAVIGAPDPPAGVHEVLRRRIDQLPEEVAGLLQVASVVGREFDGPTLAAAARSEVGTTTTRLEPAVAAGMISEDGVDQFRFTHALVRDTFYSSMSASRRGQVHADLAESLEQAGGREPDVARHWLSAGPGLAPRAWPAAVAAAGLATAAFAHEEAADLLRQALVALASDPKAGPAERFDLLRELAGALRRDANWIELRVVTHQAIAVADELQDVDRLIDAAVVPSIGALWQPSDHGAVDDVVVAALRRALDLLPTSDDPRRCRAMLALATEIYYGATPLERETLAEEAVAMARRIDDPALTLTACLGATVSTWRAATASSRLDLAAQAIDLARDLGDEIALSAALTIHAGVNGELGRIDEMTQAINEARTQADRQRDLYSHLVLDTLEAPWLAMRGDPDGEAALVEHIVVLGQRLALPQYETALASSQMSSWLWRGRLEEVVDTLEAIRAGGTALPVSSLLVCYLARAGRLDEARERLTADPIDLDADWWFSPLAWATTAEAAIHLGDPALGAAAYQRLSPLAGRSCSAGSGWAVGPADIYLACAASAVGESDLATRHADDGATLCQSWRIQQVTEWFSDLRERHGF